MRAWQIQDRFGLDALTLVERPEPRPAAGQVVVRVRAASLNYRDLLTVEGSYNPRQPLPLVPLSDGAGEVIAVGRGVTRVRVGDRVAGIFNQAWITGPPRREHVSHSLGGPLDGMLAAQVVLDGEGTVFVPEHLSFEEAACLPCAAVTAWNALVEQGGLARGQTVLVLGPAGWRSSPCSWPGASGPASSSRRRARSRRSARARSAPSTPSTPAPPPTGNGR